VIATNVPGPPNINARLCNWPVVENCSGGVPTGSIGNRPPIAAPSAAIASAVRPSCAVGCFGVTMRINQPLNLMLAAMTAERAATFWPQYAARWLRWNHVRTAAALFVASLF